MNRQTTTQRLVITNSHCENCYKLIKSELEEKHGVERVEYNYQDSLVTVDYNPTEITVKNMIETVAGLGYEAIADNQ